MRILKIRFTNINSLKGDFEIDFTKPELSGHGIFAIMGQTGSGKTTILDAVSLAMFGKTPRLNNLSARENELMTRGTSFCHAEVTFQALVEGRSLEFRSIWEQKRIRRQNRKPDANDFHTATMDLVQVGNKEPGDDWEASGVSGVPRKVEEVTGLNFERFTRTCLLAQGQFAAFLDAKSGERAQILEQITGTDIYCKLSQAAYERDKEASAKVDALRNTLQGITILSDEEFTALRQKVVILGGERDACDAQKQIIQQHIGWIKNLNTLVENLQNLVLRQQSLTSERETHTAEFLALANGRRAEPARLPLAQRDDLIDKRGKRESALTETRALLPAVQQALIDSQTRLEKAKKDRDDFQKVLESEQKLITETRAYDQQIKGLSENHAEVGRQHDSVKRQLADTDAQVLELDKTISNLQELQKKLNAHLDETAIDKTLGSDLKALEALADQHQEIGKQLAAATKERETSNADISRTRNDLKIIDNSVRKASEEVLEQTFVWQKAEKNLSDVFPGITIKALQESIRMAQRQQTDTKSLQALGEEMREQAGEEKQATVAIAKRGKGILAAEKALATLEKEREKADAHIEELNEKKVISQTVASLQDHRQQLEDGKPCPLCGALKHPYATGKKDDADLREIDALLKKEKAHLKKLIELTKGSQSLLSQLAAEQAVDERTIKNHGKAMADLLKKWERLARGFDQVLTPENKEQLEALVAAADDACKKAETAFEGFQTAGEDRDKAEKVLAKAKEKLQSFEKKQAASQGTVSQAQALEQKAGQRQSELIQQREATETRLRSDVHVYGFSEFDQEVIPALKARWEAFQKMQKKRDQTVLDMQESLPKLAGATTQKEGFSRQLIECRESLAKTEAGLTALRTTRRNVYGDKKPDYEEKKLQAVVIEHHQKEQCAAEQVQGCRLKLEKLRTTEINLAADLEVLTKELAEAIHALDATRQSGGFPDEPSLLAALLLPDELKRLSELEKHFETKTAQLQGQLEGLKKQIADHETQRPTTQTLEELTQAEVFQTEKVALAMIAWQEQLQLQTTHQQNRQNFQDLLVKIESARKEGEPWSKLNMLIGSANGKKFQEFAQGLTFSNLVYQANQQLGKLTDRYFLANDGLELQITDRYIANAKASAKNLSGGEKFLASLALALGLAHMVGRKYRMDTLFIDEGFGALDPQTLETAVSVLCSLQQQGKLIGIISHVESLKDRLPVRLDVVRLGGGLSTISGPGCIRHS